MYRVTCNGKLLHDSQMESLRIHNTKIDLELGKTGSFEFVIYPEHPYYDSVNVMLSYITVYRLDKILFNGRVLKIEYGFHNEKRVACEGELSYLLDTLIEPIAFYGSYNEYFDHLIKLHNAQVDESKQFSIGDFTIAEFYPYEVVTNEYITTWEELNKKFVDASGGYLQARTENGVRYLDMLSFDANINNKSNQRITYGKNLLDIQREVDGSEVFSAIIPLGEEVNGVRVDIGDVNNWVKYLVNEEAVATYGMIYKVVQFDGITDPNTLLIQARRYLEENFAPVTSIEITVADISPLDPALDSFIPGQWVEVYSKHHFDGGAAMFLVRKMTIDILNPDQTRIVIGRVRRGITDSIAKMI